MKNMINHRQTGKTGWRTFWVFVEAFFPDGKEKFEEIWKEYATETGDFSLDGFLKHMEEEHDCMS